MKFFSLPRKRYQIIDCDIGPKIQTDIPHILRSTLLIYLVGWFPDFECNVKRIISFGLDFSGISKAVYIEEVYFHLVNSAESLARLCKIIATYRISHSYQSEMKSGHKIILTKYTQYYGSNAMFRMNRNLYSNILDVAFT